MVAADGGALRGCCWVQRALKMVHAKVLDSDDNFGPGGPPPGSGGTGHTRMLVCHTQAGSIIGKCVPLHTACLQIVGANPQIKQTHVTLIAFAEQRLPHPKDRVACGEHLHQLHSQGGRNYQGNPRDVWRANKDPAA